MAEKKTKQMFFEQGFQHGASGIRTFPADSKSWQGIAYNDGFATRVKQLALRAPGKSVMPAVLAIKHPPNHGINLDRMAFNTDGWPEAAAEHARLLAIEINDNPAKRERLTRSLHRLQKRWA